MQKKQLTLEEQADRLLQEYAKSKHVHLSDLGVIHSQRWKRIAKHEIAMSDFLAESKEKR